MKTYKKSFKCFNGYVANCKLDDGYPAELRIRFTKANGTTFREKRATYKKAKNLFLNHFPVKKVEKWLIATNALSMRGVRTIISDVRLGNADVYRWSQTIIVISYHYE